MKGVSIGIAPIKVRYIKLFIQKKKLILKIILFFILLVFLLVIFVNGSRARIKMEDTRANTPPNLLGIVRKIA